MEIKYVGAMRQVAGGKDFQEPYFPSVRGLLNYLGGKYGRKMRDALLDEAGEDLAYAIIVLVNGRNIVHLQGIDTPLDPADLITIMPMSQGG